MIAPAEQLQFGFAPGRYEPRRRRRWTARPARDVRRAAPHGASVPDQCPLPLPRLPGELRSDSLQAKLAALLPPGSTLRLTLTDNCCSLLTVKRRQGHFEVRLHHMFEQARPVVLGALARYIERSDGSASRIINAFIDQEDNQKLIRQDLNPASRRVLLNPFGCHFDLQEIFEQLNVRHFAGAIRAEITWGRSSPSRPRRHASIKMGSYSVDEKLIRLHPSLDRPFIPRYFVESIVFHEMLHQVHDIPVINGRRHFHTEAFLAHERRFPEYERAKAWESANLSRLLYF